MVRLERKAGASFRMDPQDQQEAGGVWLEGKTRVSFRMELQGQEDAVARVVSEACIASVDSVVKWPELLEWLEWPDVFSICVARGLFICLARGLLLEGGSGRPQRWRRWQGWKAW